MSWTRKKSGKNEKNKRWRFRKNTKKTTGKLEKVYPLTREVWKRKEGKKKTWPTKKRGLEKKNEGGRERDERK